MNIVSETTKTTVYKTRILSVDKFLVTESYTDGVLTGQKWSVEGGFIKTHPDAYDPNGFRFNYYEDISFLQSEQCSDFDSFYELIPKSKLVTDWDNFNLDHILCIYLRMDGNIYKINDPNPVSLWRNQGYIGGFDNKGYKLTSLAKKLKGTKNIRNVELIDIPYYNCDDGRTKAVEFEYFGGIIKEFEEQFFDLSEFRKKVEDD